MYKGSPDFLRKKRPLQACTRKSGLFDEKKAPAGMHKGNQGKSGLFEEKKAPVGMYKGIPDFFRKKKAPAGMYKGSPDFLRKKRALRACPRKSGLIRTENHHKFI